MVLTTDIGNADKGAQVKGEWENFFGEGKVEDAGKEFEKNFPCRLAVYRVLLLCADIGIVCEQQNVYVMWVLRLFDEMSESDPNLVPKNFYGGQEKFLDFYAKPMLQKLGLVERLGFDSDYNSRFTANRALMGSHVQALNNDTAKQVHLSI